MTSRRAIAGLIALSAVAGGSALAVDSPAVPPPSRPTNEPPTYKLKTAEQWLPAARDLDDKTRAEGIEAMRAFVGGRPDLVPLLADTMIHESSSDIFRSISWSLGTMLRVNPQAMVDRVDGLIGLLLPPRRDYSQSEIVDVLAALVEDQRLSREQRGEVFDKFGAVVAGVDGWNGYTDHVVGVLEKFWGKYPEAEAALRQGLASKSLETRRRVIAILLKLYRAFGESDAAAQIAAGLDAVKASDDSEARDFGTWLGMQTDAGELMVRMAPADQRVVARAIGRLFGRLPATNGVGTYYYDVLVSFGPAAGPAAGAARAYSDRLKGLYQSRTEMAKLDLIEAASVREPATMPATQPSPGGSPGPSGRR